MPLPGLEEALAETGAEVARLQAAAASRGTALRAPPEQPELSICCGRGCQPCMFSYYFAALDAWREDAAKRLANTGNPVTGIRDQA